MRPWLRKVIKITLALAATGAFLTLAAIGGFRVLVTQLPSYQDDLQAWVNRELGLSLTFARLDVRSRAGAARAHFPRRERCDRRTSRAGPCACRELASTCRSRRAWPRDVGVDRLTFEGTESRWSRRPTARIACARQMRQSAPRELKLDVPPDVEISRDSRVVYLDWYAALRGPSKT
jgi:hypothetical protein